MTKVHKEVVINVWLLITIIICNIIIIIIIIIYTMDITKLLTSGWLCSLPYNNKIKL